VYILRWCLKKRDIISLYIQDARLHSHPPWVRILQDVHPRCTPRFHLRILGPATLWNPPMSGRRWRLSRRPYGGAEWQGVPPAAR